MFGEIGIEKLLLILLVVLLFFGARRIPELAGSMGKGIREFKKNLADPERAARESAPLRADQAPDRVGSSAPEAAPAQPARDEAHPEPKRLIG
jgi:sec-independent protein translocase protein TatA